ncbi:MAG: potassium-transporting ATPase subunit C [Bdellovibrionales bacterium RIFCSPHIGHO2_01_FULL_40_29]|nr:MAG: potassium-transporting ATPase subunit C [Bdellovibrionales bacterium RIFCSPHIGHO2_01_FULL_40_29]OFZ34248.1 MAG: potassium-transporting ATPase subunit C [Bdellovibrionales bacterium RIFCSPHIGHO2_02_FULL_40_15]
MKQLFIGLKMFVILSVVTGIVYPAFVTGLSGAFFKDQAQGQFISRGGHMVGSILISQNFEDPKYFWSRPSAVNHNPLLSGGSNLGQMSADLKKQVSERIQKNKILDHPELPPQDLVFASASGLDPHISPEAALYQIQRIAKVRDLADTTLRHLINELTEPRQFGIFGEPRVNVLKLNLALDHLAL